jgi:Restriction endonuclease
MPARTGRLTHAAWDAVLEAVAVFHWWKDDQTRFLRSVLREHPELLSRLPFGSSKRAVASELVSILSADEARYQDVALDLIEELARFDQRFPKLARLDDGAGKVADAQAALAEIQNLTRTNRKLLEERDELRKRIEDEQKATQLSRTHDAVLAELLAEFLAMFASNDPHDRGIRLERLISRLFALHDLNPRAAYNLEHEQVDGAFTFNTDHYLLEAKWWQKALEPKELNHFRAVVESKAANTLGLCVAINGFTAGALAKHSERSPLVLMDGADLHAILENRISLPEVLERKRRHAVETGKPMYPVAQMLDD